MSTLSTVPSTLSTMSRPSNSSTQLSTPLASVPNLSYSKTSNTATTTPIIGPTSSIATETAIDRALDPESSEDSLLALDALTALDAEQNNRSKKAAQLATRFINFKLALEPTPSSLRHTNSAHQHPKPGLPSSTLSATEAVVTGSKLEQQLIQNFARPVKLSVETRVRAQRARANLELRFDMMDAYRDFAIACSMGGSSTETNNEPPTACGGSVGANGFPALKSTNAASAGYNPLQIIRNRTTRPGVGTFENKTYNSRGHHVGGRGGTAGDADTKKSTFTDSLFINSSANGKPYYWDVDAAEIILDYSWRCQFYKLMRGPKGQLLYPPSENENGSDHKSDVNGGDVCDNGTAAAAAEASNSSQKSAVLRDNQTIAIAPNVERAFTHHRNNMNPISSKALAARLAQLKEGSTGHVNNGYGNGTETMVTSDTADGDNYYYHNGSLRSSRRPSGPISIDDLTAAAKPVMVLRDANNANVNVPYFDHSNRNSGFLQLSNRTSLDVLNGPIYLASTSGSSNEGSIRETAAPILNLPAPDTTTAAAAGLAPGSTGIIRVGGSSSLSSASSASVSATASSSQKNVSPSSSPCKSAAKWARGAAELQYHELLLYLRHFSYTTTTTSSNNNTSNNNNKKKKNNTSNNKNKNKNNTNTSTVNYYTNNYVHASNREREAKLLSTDFNTKVVLANRDTVPHFRTSVTNYEDQLQTLRQTKLSMTSTRIDRLLVDSDQTCNRLATTLNLEVKMLAERVDALECECGGGRYSAAVRYKWAILCMGYRVLGWVVRMLMWVAWGLVVVVMAVRGGVKMGVGAVKWFLWI